MRDGEGHTERRLTDSHLNAVLTFMGYGNPTGPFWFVGIEERGVGDDDTLWGELRVRAEHFAQIEDLKAAQEHEAFGSTFKVSDNVPTWLIMSKIVRRLEGTADWSDYTAAKHYQAKHLGRSGGDTFLADLLPLAAGNVDHWPYPGLFPSKEIYRKTVLPNRIATLRSLIEQHRPTHVFCYGKSYWEEYQAIFPKVTDYENVEQGFAKVGRTSTGTLVALVPFFSSYAMGHMRIDRLVAKLREDRFNWHDGDVDFTSSAEATDASA